LILAGGYAREALRLQRESGWRSDPGLLVQIIEAAGGGAPEDPAHRLGIT
jgi:hypothetical protein